MSEANLHRITRHLGSWLYLSDEILEKRKASSTEAYILSKRPRSGLRLAKVITRLRDSNMQAWGLFDGNSLVLLADFNRGAALRFCKPYTGQVWDEIANFRPYDIRGEHVGYFDEAIKRAAL